MDSSLEKATRGRAGVQIAIWNDAKSWLGPIREYSRISTAIRTDLNLDSGNEDATERRLQFFGWEASKVIATAIDESKLNPRPASELLNSVFRDGLGFSFTDAENSRRSELSFPLFETVLARRTGPSAVLAMLYAWIGELVVAAYGEQSDFLRIELVRSTPTEVVRVIPRTESGKIWLIDLAKLNADDNSSIRICNSVWSTWCANSSEDGFSRLSWTDGLLRSLGELQKSLSEAAVNTAIDLTGARLFVIDRIIALQPSDTARWAERAVLNARRGDRSVAYDDLKRFFAFHDRLSAPNAIVKLFDELHAHLRPE